jgi:hypothetical protein
MVNLHQNTSEALPRRVLEITPQRKNSFGDSKVLKKVGEN